MLQLIKKNILAEQGPFSQLGIPKKIFRSRGLLAVASDMKTNWSVRISFDSRLSLYEESELKFIGYVNITNYPINDLAFHPKEPIIALGTGEYDGGYCHEGNLLIWNWETGEIRSVLEDSIDVRRVRFSDRGDSLEIFTTTPADENCLGYDEIDHYLHRDISLAAQGHKLEFNSPIKRDDSGFLKPTHVDCLAELRKLSPEYVVRSFVEDIAWTLLGEIANTLPGTRLEIWDSSGQRLVNHLGTNDSGTELLIVEDQIVSNVREISPNDAGTSSKLVFYSQDGVERSVRNFSFPVSISASLTGEILVRDIHLPKKKSEDSIIKFDHFKQSMDLGYYDSTNNFLRINDQKDLYYIQGRPKNQHKNKYLCKIDSHTLESEILWPLEWDPERNAHLLDGLACVLKDKFICSYGEEYFIAVRDLPNGQFDFSVSVATRCAALVPLTERRCVFYSLVNGEIGLLDLDLKKIVWSERLFLNGVVVIVMSAAWNGRQLAAGTNDGRILIYELND